MSGLFSTLNIGKSGMSVSQQGLNVTSHNISNSHNANYSRQRTRVVTNTPYGGTSRFSSAGVGQVGTGAQVAAIERVRDNFLDYQVRNESSNFGKYDIRSSYLYEIESIFNEPSDTGISSLIGKFFDAWQELSKQPNSSNARTVVAQVTASLSDGLNQTATKLRELQNNAQNEIRESVSSVNSILNQIDDLNKQIMAAKGAGQNPNDLLDSRDALLDDLSVMFNITIDKKGYEGIDVKATGNNGVVANKLISADSSVSTLRLSYISEVKLDPDDPSGQTYEVSYYRLGNTQSDKNKSTLKITGITPEQAKELEASRMLWANEEGQAVRPDGYPIKDGELLTSGELIPFEPLGGQMEGFVSIQNDIMDYRDQLDKLAKALAFSVNAIHSGLPSAINNSGAVDKDYMPIFVNKDVAYYGYNNELRNLNDTLLAEGEITAENISINREVLYDVMKIKTKTNDCDFAYANQNNINGESDGSRALAIAQLRDSLIKIPEIGETINSREDLFNAALGGAVLGQYGLSIENNLQGMKIDDYFKDTIDRLGVQSQEAQRVVKNEVDLLNSLEQSRASVSGVSIDEEITNLVQLQHAYNASAKVISTVDSLLEVVINGLMR